MSHLDQEVPYGDPEATTCRWCHGAKTRVSGAWLCRGCDGAGHTHAVGNEGRRA